MGWCKMKNENLKLLVDNANSEIKKLVNFLENNKGLYENRNVLPVTIRDNIIYFEDNKLDLAMTVSHLVYLNFSSDYFIEDFIGENALIDYDNIENIVKELEDKYALTSECILEELRYRLDYIYYDLYNDFMNEMDN